MTASRPPGKVYIYVFVIEIVCLWCLRVLGCVCMYVFYTVYTVNMCVFKYVC